METKKQKAKGPLRTEAIISISVLVLIFYVFFHFFYDKSLKKAIEWAGTNIHGAEVNVGNVKTSFFAGSFLLQNLQVTDKTLPKRNLIAIEKIEFKFLWDALLRAKFVVDVAAIDGIQMYSPRKKPGYIVPPKPPEPNAGPSMSAQVQSKAIGMLKQEYDNNIIGDLAGVMGGADVNEQLKNIQSELKAEKFIQDTNKILSEKKTLWDEKFKSLSNNNEIEALVAKIKSTKIDKSNPVASLKSIQEAEKAYKELNAKVKQVEKDASLLNSDIQTLSKDIQQIDDMVKKDIADINNRLKIPSLDFQDLSKQLFTKMLMDKFGQYAKYYDTAKEYMPPPKSERQTAAPVVPPKRGDGKTYRFPKLKAYPLFWLKEARVSSKETASEYSGNIEAKLLNLSTEPKVIGVPTLIDLKASFPKQNIMGADALITVDNTNEDSYFELKANVASYPAGEQIFADSKELQLGINKAKAETKVFANLKDSKILFQLENKYTELDYKMQAKNADVQGLVQNILNAIPMIDLNAKIEGSWKDFDVSLNSNLGQELSAGFKRELQKKIDEIKKKIEDQVQAKLKEEKQKLQTEFNKIKKQFDSEIAKNTAQLKKVENDVKKHIDSEKKSANSQGKKAGEKALQDLKKKFKF